MAASVTKERGVAESVTPLLAELGFKKRAGDIFTVELAEDVIGWLGLNRATQGRPPGEVEVNPVVGVRHQEIERIVAELRGEKFHAYQPPTISTPLGYLLPQARYRAWIFVSSGASNTAKEMVAAIAEHGLPFMRSVVKLSDLCRCLEEMSGFEHQLIYRRPTAWLLAGDMTRASKVLDDSLKAVKDRRDVAATEFKRFAVALRERLT